MTSHNRLNIGIGQMELRGIKCSDILQVSFGLTEELQLVR